MSNPASTDQPCGMADESEEARLTKAHLTAVAFIESHLFEPMTVKSIADHAGLSPSGFSRGFTRIQGESVMAYVRGRRLEAALRRILTEPDTRIVDLAFDTGFDSQEAFTRAFVRAFGHPPGRMRSLGRVQSMVRKKKQSLKEPLIHERVEHVPTLTLAGLVERFRPANYVDMPALWQRLETQRGVAGAVEDGVYALVLDAPPGDGSFDFMVAMRVTGTQPPPRELRALTLPASAYVVFRQIVHNGHVYPQINAARELITSRYLPDSGRALADSPRFERYPEGLGVSPGNFVDYYFPIRA